MTVSSTTTKVSYSGDGSTTVFAYTFKVFNASDLVVIKRTDSTGAESVQTITTNYTVSGVGNANGGNVTFVTAPASGETVVIRRTSAQTQTTDYTPNDPFPAETHEEALDKLTFMVQEQQEELDRSIKISRTNTMTSTEFTVGSTDRADKILAFDSSGELAVTQEIGTYQGTDATITTAAYKERDLIKSTTAAELNNVYICVAASVVGDLLTDTDHFELVVDAVSAATSATNAAASATSAQTAQTAAETAETNAETAQTAAETAKTGAETAKTGAETAKTAAETAQTAAETAQAAAETALDTFDDRFLGAKATDPTVDNDGNALIDGALYFDTTNDIMKVYDLTNTQWRQLTLTSSNQTNVNTVAGQISPTNNIATVASRDSDIGTVAARDTDIGTVASRDTDIGTVASRDADIGTVASRDADIGTVASRDTDIGTVAARDTEIGRLGTADAVADMNTLGTAAIVADMDALADISANITTVAGVSANVTTVATNITDVNSFADTYFISATAPSAPTVGDLWFDTTNNVMKVYGSGGFINAGSAVNGTSNRETYAVGTSEGSYDGSTTVFPITYDAGFIDVYLNGVKLDPDNDFTATNGTSVTLSSAATTGDIVDMVGYGTFELANFSIGDANNVNLSGLADDQILRYNSATSNFEAEDLPTGIPDQSTHSGKFLTTDGSSASWATVTQATGNEIENLSEDTTPQLGGVLDTNGNNIEFPDSSGAEVNRLKFGAGDDLQIYHDGSHSFVVDTGTGGLQLRGSTFVALQGTNGENGVLVTENGSAQLRYNNSTKVETTSTGVDVTGDLSINDGTPAYLLKVSGTEKGYVRSNSDVTEINGTSGSALRQNGFIKLATTSGGVDITGDLGVSGNLNRPVMTARKASTQSVSRATWTDISGFTAAEYDSHNAWNGTTFTVPSGQAGRYLVCGSIDFYFGDAGSDGEACNVAIKIGTDRKQFFGRNEANGNRHIGETRIGFSYIYNLGVGDTITIQGNMQDDSASGTLKIGGNASGNAGASAVAIARID